MQTVDKLLLLITVNLRAAIATTATSLHSTRQNFRAAPEFCLLLFFILTNLLDVAGKPPDWEHPQSFLTFYAGEDMVLRCVAKQGKTIWLKNDKELEDIPSYRNRLVNRSVSSVVVLHYIAV